MGETVVAGVALEMEGDEELGTDRIEKSQLRAGSAATRGAKQQERKAFGSNNRGRKQVGDNNPGNPGAESGARGSKRKNGPCQGTRMSDDEDKCKQALASIVTLHGLLRDLRRQMKAYEYSLPMHEVMFDEDEVKDEEDLTQLIMEERDAAYLKYAQLMDIILHTTQEIGTDMENGVSRDILDGKMYSLRGHVLEIAVLYSRVSAIAVALFNTNIDWISENDYSLVYSGIESDGVPFIHDKLGVWVSLSGAHKLIEKGESSCRFAFDGQHKKTVQDVRKMLREMTDIEDSLLQGMSVNEAATKGQILGLTTYFCMDQVNLWLHRKIFFQTKVFDKCNKELFLCPLQSAGGLLQIAETCNQVRRKDLLLKTAHIQIG